MAAIVVAGATVAVTPVEASSEPVPSSMTSVDLTASTKALRGWPWLPAPSSSRSSADAAAATVGPQQAATPDDIDAGFIAFRNAARTDFHEFANRLGYLGKQLAVGHNFGETIVASAVFNGADIARGEGLSTNLGEFATDVFLAALYVLVDEWTLNIPGASATPIIGLPDRGPVDAPSAWFHAWTIAPDEPLQVPFPPDWFDPEARSAEVPENERSVQASTAEKIAMVEDDDVKEGDETEIDPQELVDQASEQAETEAADSKAEMSGAADAAPAPDVAKPQTREGAGEKRASRTERGRAA